MTIPAEHRLAPLPGERRDPDVIGRQRRAAALSSRRNLACTLAVSPSIGTTSTNASILAGQRWHCRRWRERATPKRYSTRTITGTTSPVASEILRTIPGSPSPMAVRAFASRIKTGPPALSSRIPLRSGHGCAHPGDMCHGQSHSRRAHSGTLPRAPSAGADHRGSRFSQIRGAEGRESVLMVIDGRMRPAGDCRAEVDPMCTYTQ